MNKQYARTDYEGCEYITAGKLYLIKRWDGGCFEITGENQKEVYCNQIECCHIAMNDWEIIEESETMNVLTGKQGMQTAVMDWAEEQANRGRWVDIVWDADLKSCAARVGAAGAWEKQVDGYGETELEARLALMKKWDATYGEAAIRANRRANLEAAADEIGCGYSVLATKGISEANSDEGNRVLFEIWARNEKGRANERTAQAEKIEETVRRMYGGGNE